MLGDADLAAFSSAICSADPCASAALSERDRKGRAVYRHLVRARMAAAFAATLPRARAMLTDEAMREVVSTFLAQGGSRSPYFRALSGELLRLLLASPALLAGLPAHFADAARLELARFEAATAPREQALSRAALALDSAVQISRSARFLTLCFGVHGDEAEPSALREPIHLLLYRDVRSLRVQQLSLTEVAAEVVSRLMAGDSLRVAIESGARACGALLSDTLLAETAEVLADLAARGVMLGARASEPRAHAQAE